MATPPLDAPAPDVLRPLGRGEPLQPWLVDVDGLVRRVHGVTDVDDVGASACEAAVRTGARTEVRGTRWARSPEAPLLLVERLDEILPGWRRDRGVDRRADVVAWRRDAHPARTPHLPLGGVDLMDRWSARLAPRLASRRWSFARPHGDPLTAEGLGDHVAGDGIVVFVRDRDWAPDATGPTRPAIDPGGSLDPSAAVADARTALVQLGLAAGFECQHAPDRDPLASAAVANLVDLVISCWSDPLRWHVDVVEDLAAGLSNLRFSDPGYVAHSPAVLDALAATLRRAGVTSAPVLLS